MKLGWPIEIAGTGAHLPEQVLTNNDFARRIDTSDEWIVQRTGIRERRHIVPGQATLFMSLDASRQALHEARLTPADLDLIIVATVTPDRPLPATACLLQAQLGCRWIPAFDIAAACSGYVFAMLTAAQFINHGLANTALIVGAESLSTITDQQDRATAVLFGDAAGAAVIRRSTSAERLILSGALAADGARADLITIPAGGSAMPATPETLAARLHYMKMAGREVYKFAVTQMQETMRLACEDAGVEIGAVKLVIPHQSNLRIIESACEKAGVPMDRVMVNIDRYGNTSSASIATALHEARATGRVAAGDLVLLVAFGAGLTWGSVLLRI